MRWIPGGTFRIGCDTFYPEERPAHHVTIDGFWIDQYTVTNADLAQFVAATGYLTVAERPPDPALYPGADPELLGPGSAVFHMPRAPRPAVVRCRAFRLRRTLHLRRRHSARCEAQALAG
ncbi:MAG: formylglycine-generating enzyme family protein [Gemmataceae bacterium]